MSRFICLLLLCVTIAATLYALAAGSCGLDPCEVRTNDRLASKPLHLGVQWPEFDRAPAEAPVTWSKEASKQAYNALKRESLSRMNSNFAKFVYASVAQLTLAKLEQKPSSELLVARNRLPSDLYRAQAPSLETSAPMLIPSRGLTTGLVASEEESTQPLITYKNSSWRAGALNSDVRRSSTKLSCSDKAQRTWRGEGRISHQDYVEPFVVCEGGDSFSVSVDWRTSDVCVAQAGLKLPSRITEVSVLTHAERGGAALGRARGKDRLSIRTEEGSRVLLSCDDAVWAIARVGKTAWRNRSG